MIIIDSNNTIYQINPGEVPSGAVAPLYKIFTPEGFVLKFNIIKTPINPGAEKIDYFTQKIPINPWTYWDTDTKMTSIRLQRDYLLQKTDWRTIKSVDTEVPESQAWRDYRQALRDFPSTVNVNLPIEQIVWPTPPNA